MTDSTERAALVPALRTVVAIPVAPFDEAGRVDETAYARIVARMLDAGVTALTPNGNTSEFYALADGEADRLMRLTVEIAGDRALVVPGVGHDIGRATAMARAAAAAGAPAVMVHQPIQPYRSVDGWLEYHREVADAAPGLGLVPYVRDPVVDATALAALAQRCPSLVAVKYGLPDVVGLHAAVAAVRDAAGADRLAWICGLAETRAPFAWLAGARGFTSGLVNVAPERALRLLDLLRKDEFDAAMAWWETLLPMEQIRARHEQANNVSAVKEALSQLGLCGAGVRPPLSPLTDADRQDVRQLLVSWGLLTGSAATLTSP